MPQIADITVKKTDGTTNVVYNGVVPSAGDKSPAVFKALAAGTSGVARPELRISSAPNKARTTRALDATFVYPTVNTLNGVTTAVHKTLINIRVTVPEGAPDVDVAEAIDQGLNLLGSTLIRSSMKSGYAPS
jgi:hypothetical protein